MTGSGYVHSNDAVCVYLLCVSVAGAVSHALSNAETLDESFLDTLIRCQVSVLIAVIGSSSVW